MAQPILDIYQGGTSGATASAARTALNAQNKLFYTVGFNAKDDYVCDGTADNVQIQQAIDDAAANGVNHVHIRGNTNSYDIAAGMSITTDNFILTGDGRSTHLVLADAVDDFMLQVGDDVTDIYNVTIRDISLDGNKANQAGDHITAGTAWGIYFWKAHNCTVDNVVANNFSPVGISFADTSSHNKIIACEGSYCYFDGFNINSSTDNLVVGCIGQHNGHGAIISRFGENNVITGNDFSHNDYLLGFGGQGVVSEKGKRNIIANNNCQYNYGSGISVWDEEQVIVEGNQCNENGFNGIRLNGFKRSVVKDNMCVNNGQFLGSQRYGILLQKQSGVGTLEPIDNLIEGNWTSNTGTNTSQTWGIKLEDTADMNVISNNHCQDATTHGISVVNTGNLVRNNHNVNPDKYYSIGNAVGTFTVNRSNGNVQNMTLTGNITMSLADGLFYNENLTIIFTQDSTGSRILTMSGSNFSFSKGKMLLSTNPNAVDTLSLIWTGTLWREVSRTTNGYNVDASVAAITLPYQVTSNTDGQILFKFNTDRAWQFEQQGTGASTNLVLKDTTGDKHFLLRNSSGSTVIDFLPSNANATAAITVTPQVAAQEAINVTTTKTGRALFLSKIITNAANTADTMRINFDSVVSDAGTYAKSGAAFSILGTSTQTSGTITDTSNLALLTQSFTGASGSVLKIDNRGTGKGLQVVNNATEYFSVGGTGTVTMGTLSGVLKASTGAISGSATLNDIGAPTADFSMASHKLTSVTNPTSAQDAATKSYVDSVASGLNAKASCRVATTANITLSGTQTIDGISVIANDRVLVKNQTTGSENGIYVCASGAWSRSTDADTDAEVVSGMYTFITSGTTNASTGWVLITPNPITVGTTALTFAQFSAAASISAGNGIVAVGSTIHFAQSGSYTAGEIPFATSTSAIGFDSSLSWDSGASQLLIGPGITLDAVTSNSTILGRVTLGSITMNTGTASTVAYFDAFNSLESLPNGTGVLTNNGSGSLSWVAASTGDVVGPASATNTALVRYDGTTGKLVKDSSATLANNGQLTLTNTLLGTDITLSGNIHPKNVSTIWPSSQGAANSLFLNDGAGNISWVTDLPTAMTIGGSSIYRASGSDVVVADGGTGASTNTAGFNNLAPTTTQGDMIYHNGTNNVRLAKGTGLQMMRMNSGGTAPEWFTSANDNHVELASDVTFTATSFANITGLSFNVTSTVNYRFYAILVYTASVATCGIRVSMTTPSTTLFSYKTSTGLSTTGSTDSSWDNWQATTDAGTVSTSSISTSGNLVILEGFIRPSASGTVQLRAAIETTTGSPSLVMKAGSSLRWW